MGLKIIRAIIWLSPLVMVGWLVVQDLMPTGQLTAEYNFVRRSPYVLTLAPRSRITEVRWEEGDAYQTLIDDPVYFDVRVPRAIDTITLTLRYRTKDDQAVQLAAFYNKDQWQYQLLPWETVSPPDAAGWQTATATVAMADKRFAWQKYQFMISLPGLQENGRQVDLTTIQLQARRPPLTPDRFWTGINRRLGL